MNIEDNSSYSKHYLKIYKTYPSVFALKMFLGTSPYLDITNLNFKNKKILDIGFGDGRDLNLFLDLGFQVYGIEPSLEVVSHTKKKFNKANLYPKLSQGTNIETNLKKRFFDFVYASGSIYYMPNEKCKISDAFSEVYRILKKGGYFLGTLAKNNTHTTKGAREINPNIFILKDDFYKQREGQVYHTYEKKSSIKHDLTKAGFFRPYIFNYDVNWFGTRETLYLFICQKTN